MTALTFERHGVLHLAGTEGNGKGDRPVRVAVIGGGCASMAAAFELTRPEHRGKYHVTVYQLGWRLGGKGASGRGPADRIEEHGLHVWLGFYENAFRLLRECYAELGRDPRTCPIADWLDAFFPDTHIGIADPSRRGGWITWSSHFPPGEGLPGDPLTTHNPFALSRYLARTASLLRTLLFGLHTHPPAAGGVRASAANGTADALSSESAVAAMKRLLKYGLMTTAAGLIEALSILEVVLKSFSGQSFQLLVRFVESLASSIRVRCEEWITGDDEQRLKWEIIDLVVAILVGMVRFRLLTDPRGLDAINEYECREWLRLNGASERALESAFVRGLYDLALAYEGGDPTRPGLAAGQALRGSLRMFFTYRGSIFWKMRAGMGDVVFAPFYEVLKKRGVDFKFFHRLENLRLAASDPIVPGQAPHVAALEFDIQAKIRGGAEYQPLIDLRGLPCWPAEPDYSQLVNGPRCKRDGWNFESHWDRRKADTLTLEVGRDFDFVVLGVSIGAVPQVCKEILVRDRRWRDMVAHVKTVASQAFQIWINEDMWQLGWHEQPVTISGFRQPFDTWSDMGHLAPWESWQQRPAAIAYFCNILADPPVAPDRSEADYPEQRRAEVKSNAIRFLNQHIHHLWPHARAPGRGFRWELLVDPKCGMASEAEGESRFDSQYWRANVNPTDRYVLALPGTLKYRISPLDNTYDNLTIAGDWTDCGFNEGCVEAAVMSGRLAAHAIAQTPALEDIIGYDHP